jgi:hypothetical protein
LLQQAVGRTRPERKNRVDAEKSARKIAYQLVETSGAMVRLKGHGIFSLPHSPAMRLRYHHLIVIAALRAA